MSVNFNNIVEKVLSKDVFVGLNMFFKFLQLFYIFQFAFAIFEVFGQGLLEKGPLADIAFRKGLGVIKIEDNPIVFLYFRSIPFLYFGQIVFFLNFFI